MEASWFSESAISWGGYWSVTDCLQPHLAFSVAEAAPPGIVGFKPHLGPVYGLAVSPFIHGLVVSAGTDGLARLYKYTQVREIPVMSAPGSGSLDGHLSDAAV